MYALPGQSLEGAAQDALTAVKSGATHLSFYELTIEEGTAFYKREPAGLPDGDTAAEMGEIVGTTLAEAGFEHYEVSGYAKPGRRCRHNLNYWTFGDYIGVGAGAHGKLRPKAAYFAPNGVPIRCCTWMMRSMAGLLRS